MSKKLQDAINKVFEIATGKRVTITISDLKGNESIVHKQPTKQVEDKPIKGTDFDGALDTL